LPQPALLVPVLPEVLPASSPWLPLPASEVEVAPASVSVVRPASVPGRVGVPVSRSCPFPASVTFAGVLAPASFFVGVLASLESAVEPLPSCSVESSSSELGGGVVSSLEHAAASSSAVRRKARPASNERLEVGRQKEPRIVVM
jgi:hypothetical protein